MVVSIVHVNVSVVVCPLMSISNWEPVKQEIIDKANLE